MQEQLEPRAAVVAEREDVAGLRLLPEDRANQLRKSFVAEAQICRSGPKINLRGRTNARHRFSSRIINARVKLTH